MGFSHGSNDAQKTMGIICLALIGATKAGTLNQAPEGLHFLRTAPDAAGAIPIWIKVTCAVTMSLGTAVGGWKIIKTMGLQIVKLQTIHGFAAETTAATVLMVAQSYGMPVSTTHAIKYQHHGGGACPAAWGVESSGHQADPMCGGANAARDWAARVCDHAFLAGALKFARFCAGTIPPLPERGILIDSAPFSPAISSI